MKTYKKPMRWNAILKRLPKKKKIIGAEIGILRGQTAQRLLIARPLMFHIMIDPWKVPEKNDSWATQKDLNSKKSQKEHDKAYKIAVKNTYFAKNRIKIMRMQSKKAVKEIEDKSLDYVFIDGDHSYEGVKLDIKLWLPKIKIGGWIGGHDYKHKNRPDFSGIDKAVEERFSKEEIEIDANHTWFVRIK